MLLLLCEDTYRRRREVAEGSNSKEQEQLDLEADVIFYCRCMHDGSMEVQGYCGIRKVGISRPCLVAAFQQDNEGEKTAFGLLVRTTVQLTVKATWEANNRQLMVCRAGIGRGSA